MFRIKGPITRRLTEQLDPRDPAWTPSREATTPPARREPTGGWPVTGRTTRTT